MWMSPVCQLSPRLEPLYQIPQEADMPTILLRQQSTRPLGDVQIQHQAPQRIIIIIIIIITIIVRMTITRKTRIGVGGGGGGRMRLRLSSLTTTRLLLLRLVEGILPQKLHVLAIRHRVRSLGHLSHQVTDEIGQAEADLVFVREHIEADQGAESRGCWFWWDELWWWWLWWWCDGFVAVAVAVVVACHGGAGV